MNSSDLPLVSLVLLLFWPFALAGLALVNAGLGRARSASQSLLGSCAIVAVSAVAFAAIGGSIAAPGGPVLWIAGKPWNWTGAGPLFFSGLSLNPLEPQTDTLFVFFGALMISVIPWGAGADRLRLAAGCAMAAVLSAIVYPVFAHWTWGAGWLAQLGTNVGGSSFIDCGGAGAVHVTGGLAALCTVWLIGPRKGKFPREGLATAMPAHNTIYVLSGSLLALAGFAAWNCAGALLWLHAPFTLMVRTAMNTVLAAAGALLATLIVTRVRFGKPDASLCANGWLAGLVTSTACAALVPTLAALCIGMVAGILTPLLVEVFELALSIDDPSGAIAVHLCGGLWGLLAASLFGPRGQASAELVGIAALLGLILPVLYGFFALLNRFLPLRADADGERLGMDLHELGGSAYPEFVLHRDDSYH